MSLLLYVEVVVVVIDAFLREIESRVHILRNVDGIGMVRRERKRKEEKGRERKRKEEKGREKRK